MSRGYWSRYVGGFAQIKKLILSEHEKKTSRLVRARQLVRGGGNFPCRPRVTCDFFYPAKKKGKKEITTQKGLFLVGVFVGSWGRGSKGGLGGRGGGPKTVKLSGFRIKTERQRKKAPGHERRPLNRWRKPSRLVRGICHPQRRPKRRGKAQPEAAALYKKRKQRRGKRRNLIGLEKKTQVKKNGGSRNCRKFKDLLQTRET